MKDTDKTIEVMKAAMEKEKEMKEQMNEEMDDTTQSQFMNAHEEDVSEDNDCMADETPAENSEENSEKAPEESPGKGDKAKGLFKNSKNKELAAKDAKIEELTDRLMRQAAEFDNYRKRTEKEKIQMYDIGAKEVVEKILPIIDNFERGLGTLSEKDKESGFAQGIELIYKQLMGTLEEMSVKPVEAVGKEFDPHYHNAVMHGEDDSLGENIVSDEFQKGYMYKDIVIRHSMVKVVN